MGKRVDWYSSEKYIDLLLDLKHTKKENCLNSNSSMDVRKQDEAITLKKWLEYRLTHSRIKQTFLGKVLVRIKRLLGIRFY